LNILQGRKMKDTKSLKQQRWGMLTNPHYPPLEEMTKLEAAEVMNHLMLIDILNDGPPLTEGDMKKCRKRFMKFCQVQYKNRN